jgi:hypothetical protein
MKCDKLIWLKSIDYNLKTNAVHFWKYLSFFCKKKNDKNYIELEFDGKRLSQPCEITEAFAAHVFYNHCMRDFSTDFRSMTKASASNSSNHKTRAPSPIKTRWT